MIEKIDYTIIINNFFRDNELPNEKLKEIHQNYKNELEGLGKNGGCTRCKKNTVRRKYKKLILEHLKTLKK